MEIIFKLTEEDYINYNIAHSKKSPSMKKNLLIQRFVGPVTFMITPFILTQFTDIPLWYWLSVFGIASVLWFVFYPNYFRREIAKRVKKMLEEGNNENLFDRRVLVLTEDGIIEKSSIGESHIPWAKINHLEETADYFYIYISSVSAHIIPKRVFGSLSEQESFAKKITENINK